MKDITIKKKNGGQYNTEPPSFYINIKIYSALVGVASESVDKTASVSVAV